MTVEPDPPPPASPLAHHPPPWPSDAVQPVLGCACCAELAERQRDARRADDGSRRTDCYVLWQRHVRAAHP